MSAPPIGIINKTPTKNDIATMVQNKLLDCVLHKKNINIIKPIPKDRFKKCCPVKVIGEPDIIPLNFKNAIIEPVKVIAPMEAPKDIAIKLAILILPAETKVTISGFKKADTATKTAANPNKL